MSLRLRLIVGIVALVGLVLFLAWGVIGRAVLRPFAREVFDEFLDQAVYIAESVDGGESPDALGRSMGLDVRRAPGPPPGPAERHIEVHRGHRVAFPPGPRDHVAVETDSGWILVRRDLDLDRPRRKVGSSLLVLGVLVVGMSIWLSLGITRPVRTATDAMARVAEGNLGHRLPVDGPPELAILGRSFNAMADRVDAMLRRERELLAGLSHELRTPLARLRLQTELMRESGSDAGKLDLVEANLSELDALIEEMLTLSRLELGQIPLSPEPLALRELVLEALGADPLPRHEVAIVGEGGTVRADRALSLRALSNVLSNAARYTPADSTVTLRLEPTGLAVLDQGPGVPAAALERLFEPFYRAESSRSKESGGLGLGLMIVQRAMQAQSGAVRVENRPEGGLAVYLDWPSA